VGAVASRLAGSADLYQAQGELPVNSINFVTCHDGFTLNDLVSYNLKHNEANGEGNRDGINDNLSWNCGVEGPSGDPGVEALRERQIRNFAVLLMLSRGVPMFVAGDEVRRTQMGNNNAYCQDNGVSWFDWTLTEQHAGLLRFWRLLIEFRKGHAALRLGRFFSGDVNERGLADVVWHGTRLNQPGWSDLAARALGMTLAGFDGDADLHVMMNMYWESLDFEVPAVAGRRWLLAIDTARRSPGDIADAGMESETPAGVCSVAARSVVVLVNRAGSESA
jgi:glycogen operon protein